MLKETQIFHSLRINHITDFIWNHKIYIFSYAYLACYHSVWTESRFHFLPMQYLILSAYSIVLPWREFNLTQTIRIIPNNYGFGNCKFLFSRLSLFLFYFYLNDNNRFKAARLTILSLMQNLSYETEFANLAFFLSILLSSYSLMISIIFLDIFYRKKKQSRCWSKS